MNTQKPSKAMLLVLNEMASYAAKEMIGFNAECYPQKTFLALSRRKLITPYPVAGHGFVLTEAGWAFLGGEKAFVENYKANEAFWKP